VEDCAILIVVEAVFCQGGLRVAAAARRNA